MQLGGTPPQLYDQAAEGTVDIVWTLPGNTPGRFPSVEVFELPFTMTSAEATSRAYWDIFDKHLRETEFADTHILGTWVHGPGIIHSKEPVASIEDLSGMTVRAPTRVITALLTQLGANPIGMPIPQVPEALSKGVIQGAVVPWEVTTALRVPELVEILFKDRAAPEIYTTTFVLAMNKAKYDSLPDDLKAIIDENSGAEFSAFAGRAHSGSVFGAHRAVETFSAGRGSAEKRVSARYRAVTSPVPTRIARGTRFRGSSTSPAT